MSNAACKWKEIGVQLLPSDQENEIQNIEDNFHGNVKCFQRCLWIWLTTDTDATWDKLIEALRCRSVSLYVLANELEQKFANRKYGIQAE